VVFSSQNQLVEDMRAYGSPSGEGGAAARVRVYSVAIAAQGLNPLRETWLNPPEWTERRPTSADF
jgi:hypothetical protein